MGSQPPFTATSAQVALEVIIKDDARRVKLFENVQALRKALLSHVSEDFKIVGDVGSPITYLRLKKKLVARYPSRDAQEIFLENVSNEALNKGILVRRAIFRPKWSLKKNALNPVRHRRRFGCSRPVAMLVRM